jgi:hypothetical protein
MADRQKIIKALEWWCKNQKGEVLPLAYSAVVETLEALKEQEEVVHCGDCENFCFDNISPNAGRCMLTNKSHSRTWFCAHGKREEGGEVE